MSFRSRRSPSRSRKQSEESENLQVDFNELLGEYETLASQNQELTSQHAILEAEYAKLLSEYELAVGVYKVEKVDSTQNAVNASYAWEYQGNQWTLTISISESLLKYYRGLDRVPSEDYYSLYVTHPYDDEYIEGIVEKFSEIAVEKGYSELPVVNLLISFVQSLPYTLDNVTTGFDEYARYSVETLADGGGDCEDTSLLTAALLNSMNHPVVLIGLPDHMAVDVPASGAYYPYNGSRYYYLETTGEGWELGGIPSEYEETSASIFPLEPLATLTHDWSAEWELTDSGYALKVTVFIQNMGTLAAEGLKAYTAYAAADDLVWYPLGSDSFNLNLGGETAIVLTLPPLRHRYTRLIVGVLNSDGRLIDVSHSEWFMTR